MRKEEEKRNIKREQKEGMRGKRHGGGKRKTVRKWKEKKRKSDRFWEREWHVLFPLEKISFPETGWKEKR